MEQIDIQKKKKLFRSRIIIAFIPRIRISIDSEIASSIRQRHLRTGPLERRNSGGGAFPRKESGIGGGSRPNGRIGRKKRITKRLNPYFHAAKVGPPKSYTLTELHSPLHLRLRPIPRSL